LETGTMISKKDLDMDTPRESVYSNDTGDGYGFGTSDGKGCNLYPHALVQYWKDKI